MINLRSVFSAHASHLIGRLIAVVLGLSIASAALANSASWDVNANGNWTTDANWTGIDPQALTDVATFGNILSANRTVTLDQNRSIDSVIFNANNFGYTIAGTNRTLTLNGANGITQNGSAANTINSRLNLATDQTWGGTGTGNLTVAGVISGNGAITKNGNYTLVLSGANNFTGAVNVNEGAVRLTNAGALGASTWGNTVASGATLELQGGINVQEAGFNINGTGVGGSGAIRNISGNNVLSAQITVDSAASITSTAGTLTLSGFIGANQNLTLGGAGNITVSGTLNGSGVNLIKEGTGTLTLSGATANSFSGTTTINAGTAILAKTSGNAIAGPLVIGDGSNGATVRFGASNQITDYTPVTINQSSVLNLNGYSNSIHSLTMTGGSVTTGAGTLTLANTGSGAITTNASSTASTISGKLALGAYSHTFTVADGSAANDLDISAAISGSGANNLVKEGAGTLQLSGNNTFTGSLAINAGTLRVGSDSNFGNATNDLILNGGSLNTTSSFTLGNSRTITLGTNGGTINTDTGTTLTLGLTNQLLGSGSLTKTDTGTLAINSSNTGYTGPTNLDGGTVRLGDYQSLGTGTITISNGAKLDLAFDNDAASYTAIDVTINNGTILRTSTANATTGLIDSAHTLTVTGNATLIDQGNDGSTGYLGIGGAVNVQSGATLTATATNSNNEVRFGFDKPITIAAGGTLATTGSGTVAFGNSYSRSIVGQGTSTQESVLRLGAANNIANTGTNLQVDGSGTGGLRIEGTKAKVDALVTDTRLAATTGSGGTLTIAYTDAGNRTITNTANLVTASTINLGLVSNGGTFTLGTAGGATGDLANWGGLVVGANTTVRLADNYVFGSSASLYLNGGTLALNGTSQTFGALSVDSSSVIDFGGVASVLNVNSVSIATGAILTIANWTNSIDYFYSLLNPGTTNLSQIVFTTFSADSTHWQSWDKQVTPVPEPATYGFLLMAAGLGLYFWRRRRTS